jgi:hypothetical protein
MALSLGNTLSLGSLGQATGDYSTPLSNVSLGTIEGSPTAGEDISLSSFALGATGVAAVGTISGFTYAVENTSETYTLGFTGAGSRFSEISSRAANFTWSVPVGSKISLSTNNGASAVFAVGDMTIGAPQNTLQSIITHTLRVKFADGFNDHASNYNVNRDKTVYSVDSYDGNSTALCLKADTLVTLIDGTQVEIGDLVEGDKLKGYSLEGLTSDINMLDWSAENELTPTETEVEVLNLVFSFAERVYDINSGEIVASAEHPLLVNSNGIRKFKTIHQVEVGDFLIKADGTEIEVVTVDIHDETTEIVSLDVTGPDTYLANGYITHNKGGNTHTDLSASAAPSSFAYTAVNGENKNLTWVAPTSSGTTGITAYDIQVATDVGFSNLLVNIAEYSTTTLNIVAQPTGTLYARVRAIDHGLKSIWSTISFSHTQGIGI